MSLSFLLLLLFISSGGIAIGGAITSLLGWLLLVVLLVWEYKVYIFTFVFSVIVIKLIISAVSDYNKYKDEPPEQREERLKTNKMIDEWRKRNQF